MQYRWINKPLLAILLCSALQASAVAAVRAQLDRSKVYAGDPVLLIIESDGRKSGEPDLSPLDADFRVVGNNTSTQVNIINGRRSDKTRWSVQLEPRRLGTLRIPPLRVGNEQTTALEVEVKALPAEVAARQSEHIFIEVEADTGSRDIYVQQQIPYTVRLFYDEQILNGELETPQPKHAVVEQLGDESRYTATRKARRYNVIERRYAIAAEKSGPLQIPPVAFKGEIAHAPDSSAPGFPRQNIYGRFFRNSPFANDPFFSGTPFANRGRPLRIQSESIAVNIQPRPAAAGNTWLPAEQLGLQDSWADNPPQLRAGEPVQRTITLQARGLSGTQLPKLPLLQSPHVRLYPDAPAIESRTDGNRIYGISKQSFTYIPDKSGMLEIPAVALEWWNTHTDSPETARLPAWEFNVEPAAGGAPAPTNTPATRQAAASTTPEAAAGIPQANDQQSQQRFTSPLVAGALLFLLIALLAIALLLPHVFGRKPGETVGTKAGVRTPTKIKPLLQRLKNACERNDPVAAAEVLLELGQARWSEDPPRSLGELSERLDGAHDPLMALDRALYGARSDNWNGVALWHAIKHTWNEKQPKARPGTFTLRPLYPQRS